MKSTKIEKKPTGKWWIKLIDGRKFPFYYDYEEKVSPFKRIREFDKDKYWEIDASDELEVLNHGFEKTNEGFVLIPKIEVKKVYFKKYNKKEKPKIIKKADIISR